MPALAINGLQTRLAFAFALAVAGLAVLAPVAIAVTWRWPVRGPVIQRFVLGSNPFARGQHRGIDIASAPGTPVVAACAGRVRFAGAVGTAGATVSVACGRFVVSYLHLDAIAVRRGATLAAGDPLGTVGTSGRRRQSRPHLQFGVRRTSGRWAYVDPLRLLPRDETTPPETVPVVRRRGPRTAAPIGPAPVPAGAPQPPPPLLAPAALRTPPPLLAPAAATATPTAPVRLGRSIGGPTGPVELGRRSGTATGPHGQDLPLGSLWLPIGGGLILAAALAPLTAIRIRRRRRARPRHPAATPARRLA